MTTVALNDLGMSMSDEEIRCLIDDSATPGAQLASLVGRSVKWDCLLAAHPNATSETLTKLAKSGDRQTRRAVAMNPQTPKHILLKLAPTFPGEFFLNPVFDLLLLEDPNLLGELPVTVIKNILKRSDCPESFLRWAAAYGGRSHHLALVDRAVISRAMLEQISAGPHGPAAEKAADRLMRGDWSEMA